MVSFYSRGLAILAHAVKHIHFLGLWVTLDFVDDFTSLLNNCSSYMPNHNYIEGEFISFLRSSTSIKAHPLLVI